MGDIENGTISLAEYEKLHTELKESIRRETRLEASLHDCIKTVEKLDRMLKEAGL